MAFLCFPLHLLHLDAAVKHPEKFAVPYALGNIVALFGTAFLVGPANQCKKMFAKTRIIGTIVYLTTLIATMTVSFLPHFDGQGYIIIVLVIIQMMALFWYCASYIPFARKMIINMAKSMCPCMKS